jgi:hypothetical protein
MSFLLSLMFSLQQIREQEGGTDFAQKQELGGGSGKVAQTMCTHVSVKIIKKKQPMNKILSRFYKSLSQNPYQCNSSSFVWLSTIYFLLMTS